ncbi:MAG: hypothetical protein M3004_13755 [Bacteroidota bacterium]|nr:hypothetical protein [Bacteroidota bacterium]
MRFTPQYITDNNGRKLSVVLPVKEYANILAELEELEDTQLYDEVKARNEERISLEEYKNQRKKKKHA